MMRKTLTLSKETLRVLDDEDLARVVGGHHKQSHKGPNSGHAKKKHSSCPGAKHGSTRSGSASG